MRQILDVDVDVSGLIGLEAAVFRPGFPGLKVAQVSHTMTAQTAVQPRARSVRVQELPDHRQQIVERHQQRLAQRHRDGLLGGRQRGLQPMRRMAAVVHAVAVAPLVNRLLGHAVALR